MPSAPHSYHSDGWRTLLFQYHGQQALQIKFRLSRLSKHLMCSNTHELIKRRAPFHVSSEKMRRKWGPLSCCFVAWEQSVR